VFEDSDPAKGGTISHPQREGHIKPITTPISRVDNKSLYLNISRQASTKIA